MSTNLTVDRRILRVALQMFVEEVAAATRRDALDDLERRTAKTVARWFVFQGQVMVGVLEKGIGDRFAVPVIESQLREGLSWSDWDYLINQVLHGDHPGGLGALREIITGPVKTAYVAGADSLGDLMARYGIRFAVGSPEAIQYATANAASRVTRIGETTRKELNRLLTAAVRDGWSWQRTADAIIEKYKDFAGPPLFPSKTYESRAQAIAAYEIGDAYEAGSEAQAHRLRLLTGMPLEKRWYNAEDERVRPAHRANADAGYIPMDAAFPGDGAQRPPTDPGCRCSVGYRVAGGLT